MNLMLFAAAQMRLLSRLLPYMLGSNIPTGDEYWENFLLLLEIADLLLAPQITEDEVAYLKILIHSKFVQLYPSSSVTPNIHFLVHAPCLILE